jgi:hypothetical protein
MSNTNSTASRDYLGGRISSLILSAGALVILAVVGSVPFLH